MNTPGSLCSSAPRTRNSIPNSDFPEPAPPLINVGRPRGRPPPVISSKPAIPVGAFANFLKGGCFALFLVTIFLIISLVELRHFYRPFPAARSRLCCSLATDSQQRVSLLLSFREV